MPIYTVNGQTYDISPQEVDGFLATAQEEGLEVSEVAEDFQKATAEETAPVVAETPVDTELQSENGSLESPRRSVRKQTKQRELDTKEAKQQETIANLESEYYKAVKLEDVDLIKNKLSEELKSKFDRGIFLTEEREAFEQYKETGELPEITDTQISEKRQDEFDAKERTFMEEVPEYAQEALKTQLGDRKKEQEAKYNQLTLEYNDNVAAHETLIKNLNQSIEMGVDPTEDDINSVNASLEDIKKRSSDLIKQQADLGKTEGIYDAFKRSYSDLDMLENVLAKTGVDMALGLSYTADIMTAEGGKPRPHTKELINLSQELAKNRAEDLAKPIAVSSISNLSQFGEWAGDAIINFVPSGAMAMTGAAALPLFFTSGYSGRMSEFAVNEAEAIKNIPLIKEQLEQESDPAKREQLTKELDKYNKAINTDDLAKLATSITYGAGEAVFERFGTLKLVNDLKAARKAIPVKTYSEGILKAVKKLPSGAVIEGGTEGLTTLTQNFADIAIDGQDKSITEGMDEAMAQGALIGTGFKVAEGAVVGRAAMLDVIASREEKANIENTLKEISTLTTEFNNPDITDSRKKEIGDIISNKVKSVSESQDITSARFLRLSKEQQQEVFELDRQSRFVNKKWTATASDPSVSEASKDIIRKELEAEFNQLQQNKRDLIESADKRFKSLQSVDGLSEGDNLRNVVISETNIQKVKVHNKKSKFANKVVGLSEKDVSSMQEFVKGEESSFTTEAGETLNKSEVTNIIDNQQGVDGLFDKENKNVVVFTQRAPYFNKAAAVHEYMHAAFMAKGLTQEDFDKVKNDLISHISFDAKDRLSDEQLEGVLTKLESYNSKDQSEELFTAISDFINDDVIREKDKLLLSKLRDALKSSIAAITNPGEANNFKMDNGKQAFDFIKDFNRKIVKGKSINLGATSQPEDQEGVSLSKIVDSVTFEEGSVNQEFQKFTYDGKKNTAPESFQAEAAMAYEPLAQAVVDRISKVGLGVSKEQDQFIMDYLADNQNKQDIVSDLTFGTERNKASSLLGLAKSYNPEVGSFGGYAKSQLANRAIRILEERVGKQVTQGAQTIDAPESREVAAEDQQTETADTRNVFEKLNLPKEIVAKANKLAELASIKADKALTGKNVSDLKKVNARNKAFNDIFGKQLFKDIANELGKNTKTSDAFSRFIDKNYDSLSDIALENIDFQKGGGPAALWNIDNPPSKEEFLDYYEAKDEKASTKSDRKKSLNNAIARQIGNEARIEFAKKDPATAKLFKEKHGVVLASKIPENAQQFLNYKDLKQLFKDKNITYDYLLNTKESIDEFFKDIQPLLNAIPLEMVNRALLRPTPRIFKKGIGDKKGRKSKIKSEVDYYNEINNYYDTKLEAAVKEATEANANKLEGDAAGYVARAFEKMGLTEQKIKSQWDSGYIQQENKQNMAMHNQMWQPIYEAILKDPNKARAVGWLMMRTSDAGATHWHRMGAEMVGYSTNPVGNKKGTYIYEHAMQAKNAYLFLIESALNGVPFSNAYPAMTNNYKVIALDRFQDDKLTSAKYGELMPSGWNVYTGSWTQRYFDPQVAIFDGGIPPESIVDFNNQSIADKYNIDANGHSTKVMASKILYSDFNKMLERVKGIKAEARYSEDRATKLAANKGKFKFFVPYSAEDFVGLIYPTLGKGKEGDKNMQWYKENLLDPFAKGISNFESSKQRSMEEWRELKKSIKGTPVDLGKQAVRDFSNEEAVRVYLWNKRDVVPESLSKKDTDALVKHVEDNSNLLAFADNVVGITEGVEYPAPQGDWLAGTLTTDLVNFVNTAKRADFLQEWQDNVDVVYSKDNLNKLKAIYGKDYVDALENILYRMKTGRNRPSGTSKIEAQFMNWVNDSVATVMFLNTRSALLQTISSINFMNWSDNNPLKAAKAFANQPQFWKDFASLMNSDFLKQRRGGLKNDVNADELAREAGQATNKAKAAFAALLKAGFAPTQIADSFAISIGGASFYRNRVNTYIKQGLDQKQAEEKAMLDFKETAEESQQSSRPDKVSMEQASGLGRVILAFANTPAQYTRLTKKAALDLINGRGDWKTNASKILYYGAVQNIIFTTLQQALFALSFDDEKDEEEAMTKVANGIVDTLLRGSGVYGAGVATMKNMILEAIRQYKSKRTDYTKAALKLTTLSPPVDTKIRKLMSAGRAFTYKQSKKDMRELGIDVDNPAALAVGQIASALGNVPLDRAVLKLQNLKAASNQERETWEQIFLAMGYSEWQLGIDDDKSKTTRPKVFNTYKTGSKIPSRSEKPKSGSGKTPSPPTKRLERGVAGKAHNDGTIEVDPNLTPVEREKTIAHEKKHVKDMKAGKLNYDDNYVYWNGKKYERKGGKIKYNGKWYEEGYKSLPWEKAAYDAEPTTKEIKKRKKLY